MRSCVLMHSPLLFHCTSVMCSAVLLRRSMLGHRSVLLRRSRVRRWWGLRLRRIRLGLCLSWVRLFRGVLALCW